MPILLGLFVFWLALQGKLGTYSDFVTTGPGLGATALAASPGISANRRAINQSIGGGIANIMSQFGTMFPGASIANSNTPPVTTGPTIPFPGNPNVIQSQPNPAIIWN